MKEKILFLGLVILISFIGVSEVSAKVEVSEIKPPLFGVELGGIQESISTGEVKFDFKVSGVEKSDNIAYFKLRVYCPEKISLKLSYQGDNLCNRAVDINQSDLSAFSLYFNNPTLKTVPFSFKLKAYDTNRKWLHTEKESFHWK